MSDVSTAWLQVETLLQERFGKVPDLEGILYLIGINELGSIPIEGQKFSKEQKQDLMHIGVCTVLTPLGYYEMSGTDEDGWPHFTLIKPIVENTLKDQEQLLKEGVIRYFQQ